MHDDENDRATIMPHLDVIFENSRTKNGVWNRWCLRVKVNFLLDPYPAEFKLLTARSAQTDFDWSNGI